MSSQFDFKKLEELATQLLDAAKSGNAQGAEDLIEKINLEKPTPAAPPMDSPRPSAGSSAQAPGQLGAIEEQRRKMAEAKAKREAEQKNAPKTAATTTTTTGPEKKVDPLAAAAAARAAARTQTGGSIEQQLAARRAAEQKTREDSTPAWAKQRQGSPASGAGETPKKGSPKPGK